MYLCLYAKCKQFSQIPVLSSLPGIAVCHKMVAEYCCLKLAGFFLSLEISPNRHQFSRATTMSVVVHSVQ